jgi:hypothetical protein
VVNIRKQRVMIQTRRDLFIISENYKRSEAVSYCDVLNDGETFMFSFIIADFLLKLQVYRVKAKVKLSRYVMQTLRRTYSSYSFWPHH